MTYAQECACAFEDARQQVLHDPTNAAKLTHMYECARLLALAVKDDILATIILDTTEALAA